MIEKFFEVTVNCFISILPLLVTFILFQIFFIKMSRKKFVSVLTGIMIAFIGIVFMIFGLEVGFVPIGRAMGIEFAGLSYNWVIVPISFILGFFITKVEPSVNVLVNDVERETSGAVNKKVLTYTLAIGVGVSLALAMLKIILGISLWYIVVPGYVICLILSLFSSERFTAIAFDAGGVTTGVMTTTFLLAMALGLSEGLPYTNNADGFGLIAIVAMTPILLVMLLGKIYEGKKRKGKK